MIFKVSVVLNRTVYGSCHEKINMYKSDKHTTVIILEFQLVLVGRIQIFRPSFSVRCQV